MLRIGQLSVFPADTIRPHRIHHSSVRRDPGSGEEWKCIQVALNGVGMQLEPINYVASCRQSKFVYVDGLDGASQLPRDRRNLAHIRPARRIVISPQFHFAVTKWGPVGPRSTCRASTGDSDYIQPVECIYLGFTSTTKTSAPGFRISRARP